MDRYVIRNTDNAEFVSVISHTGVKTNRDLTQAIILYNLKSTEKLLEYLTFEINEDYIIEEIEFKTVKESVEKFED